MPLMMRYRRCVLISRAAARRVVTARAATVTAQTAAITITMSAEISTQEMSWRLKASLTVLTPVTERQNGTILWVVFT